jgi:uncharacterized protein YdeI (YjbR/CyaY-like superfamily)
MADRLELCVADVGAWRDWLDEHHARSSGVWLVLAKKGVESPTRLTYDEALDEALCYGWIDGQLRRRDERTYLRGFTPRRPRSAWSKRNVDIIERLVTDGRMHAAGLAEVARARGDGRWDGAYAGRVAMEVPADLAAALRSNPAADAMFQTLSSQDRYSILYRIGSAKRAETRAKRVEQYVGMLARGVTISEPRDPRSSGRS